MRVYIAAPWGCKRDAADAAHQFEAAGHTITKPWWEHRDVNEVDPDTWAELAHQAIEDWRGVEEADVFVVLALQVSEGKSVETGLALAYGVPIILVGTRTNLFHYLPGVVVVPTVKHALAVLRKW